jgi:uncharacterized membrane protein YraQ (UPF0718 family)/copper chaperone CopZ
MGALGLFFGELTRLVNEMSPYLLLGFFFAGVLHVVFPRRVVSRFMGGRDLRSVLNASLIGVPLPLCSCGVLPAGISFYRNGASRGSTIAFLMSTPQTGVDSILATYSLLGLPFAVIRPVVALVTGIIGGIAGNVADRTMIHEKRKVVREAEETKRSFRELIRYGFVELIQDISKWLLIGMLMAAFLSVLIPADFFTDGISNEYLAMLLVLLASVPVYICATGSIPIAAVLMMKGLSPGAALVLLMAGPATNVAAMAVIANAMGRKSMMIYMVSIIGGALLFGIMINELIPREWITGFLPRGMWETRVDHGAGWFSWAASSILLLLIFNGYLQKFLDRRREIRVEREKMKSMKTKIQVFRVEGMTCTHCKASVEKGVKAIRSVHSVVADPGLNRVTVEAEALSENDLKEVVEGLGYSFRGRI